jgi:hypothetical protein
LCLRRAPDWRTGRMHTVGRVPFGLRIYRARRKLRSLRGDRRWAGYGLGHARLVLLLWTHRMGRWPVAHGWASPVQLSVRLMA